MCQMLARNEAFPMENESLESRVARIEADVSQINIRVGNMETDLRGLRTSMDHKFESLEAKFDGKIDGLEAKFDRKIDGLEAKFASRLDAMDTRFCGQLTAMDARFEKKLDTLSKRGFALVLTLFSVGATLGAVILGVLLHGGH